MLEKTDAFSEGIFKTVFKGYGFYGFKAAEMLEQTFSGHMKTVSVTNFFVTISDVTIM